MAEYGDFPGVKVETSSGGTPSISVGAEEKVLIFGEANYYDGGNSEDEPAHSVKGDGTTEQEATAGEPRQISAPRQADVLFGGGSELAEGMKDALQNGANVDYLYGVAVEEVAVSGETPASQTGTLENYSLKENTDAIDFDDGGNLLDVEFRYGGAPPIPQDSGVVFINPLTGEYAAGDGTGSDFTVGYEYYDYAGAFGNKDVRAVVNENETGVYWALTDSDKVSSDLDTEVSQLRRDYQLVNGFCFAEPNDSTVLEDSEKTAENGGAEPLYDTQNYTGTIDYDEESDTSDPTAPGANQSVTKEHFFKPAPARIGGDADRTIGGGLAGLYAGNSINDAVYNDVVSGYQSLQQSLSKSEADDLRDEDIIPVRSGGSVRVKGNRSTAYGQSDSVAAEFWTRRIADRVILIAKLAGDEILGRINNENTRRATERVITGEMQKLVADGLIKPNTGEEQNFDVQVYEEPTNRNEVNVDIFFEPYGIAKRIDTTITVDN